SEVVEVRLEGEGARANAEAVPEADERPSLQPVARLARGHADEGRVRAAGRGEPAPTAARGADDHGRQAGVAPDPADRTLDRGHLDRRDRDPAGGLDAADREHDQAVDLLETP